MNAKTYRCPNCGRTSVGQRAYVLHLLDEAGHRGVTTNQFLAWGAGSRFGARVHELRHDEGREITEVNGLYVMANGVAGTAVMQPEQGHAAGSGVGQTAAVLEPTQLHVPVPAPGSMYDPWEDAA